MVLIAAGCGIPFSEDALIIFVGGTVLPSIWMENPLLRNQLLAALYFGVVLSDIVTFSIGRFMKKGLLEPVRRRMGVRADRVNFCEDDDEEEEEEEEEEEDYEEDYDLLDENEKDMITTDELCEIPTPELRSKDKALAILEAVGNYAGFVIRLSIGMRLPMMLATGLSGKVPYSKYILGVSAGAVVSMTLQLLFGFLLKDSPALIIASVASISTFPLVIPTLVAFVSWVSLMYKRWAMYNRQPAPGEEMTS